MGQSSFNQQLQYRMTQVTFYAYCCELDEDENTFFDQFMHLSYS